jgi:molecular chaperone GrpE
MVLTYEQLLSILKKHGIEEVECDKEFNPEFHQAVTQLESDEHESGQIVQVLQKGYKLKDRLLRASMVATCK